MKKYLIDLFIKKFKEYQALANKSIKQLTPVDLHLCPNEESNSIAVIMKHMSGNMLSRWTDFLTTDGEKEWRQRDNEFVEGNISNHDLLKIWEEGWTCLFNALDKLNDEQLNEIVYIRKEPLSVADALMRQLAHYGYHVGQIVYISKWMKSTDWQHLSMPKYPV